MALFESSTLFVYIEKDSQGFTGAIKERNSFPNNFRIVLPNKHYE